MNNQPTNGGVLLPCPKYLLVIILLLVQLVSSSAQPINPKGPGAKQPPRFHPNRLLVKPKAGNPGAKANVAALHAAQHGKVLKSFDAIGGLQVIEFPAAANIEAMAKIYSGNPAVEYAELDYEIQITATPNDPYFLDGTLWGMHNTGQSSGVADADIDAPEGWNIRNSASNVVVAVIDTGVRYTHEDLAANMWVNPLEIPGNGIDDDHNGVVDDIYGINAITGSGNPMDDNGHGTHVAGTIGAVGNNGIGVVGVAWKVKIMACKFLGASGSGSTSLAITCIDYARANGATVMNNSWGSYLQIQALADAIESAKQSGVIVVAAAGNDSIDNDARGFYPSAYGSDNIISVAATTRREDIAYFSNYGMGVVDVAAPGEDIMSSWYTSDSAYNSISGTSMAAPAVSGLVALMRAQFPSDTYHGILNRIYASVDPINVLSNKCRSGGRINLAKALSTVSSAPGNDLFANRRLLGGTSFRIEGINVYASVEPGEPNHAGNPGGHSIWYSWRSPGPAVATFKTQGSTFDTLLAVYTGSTVSNLTLVASNDNDPAGGTSSVVTFNAAAGTEYQIAVDGANGSTNSAVLTISALLRPANDQFVNGILITNSFPVTGSNSLATAETGEPTHGTGAGGHTVWWWWTAAATETVRISTLGSAFDTTLAIYTGTTVSNLSLVASNNDDPAGGTNCSVVTFSAVAGTTYRIAVDGYGNATGNITLNTPPSNDHLANAIALSGNSISTEGFNGFASKDALEPNHANNAGGKSLWWSWTAPNSGPIAMSTRGSTFDTLLAVYTGPSMGNLSLVSSNDNGPYDLTSVVNFNAIAGVTYWIAVDGANGSSGTIQLTIGNSGYFVTEMVPPSPYAATFVSSVNLSGVAAGDVHSYANHHASTFTGAGAVQLLFAGDVESHAKDINDYNQVVGDLRWASGSSKPFIWQNGVTTELAVNGSATAIDNQGRVVGWFLTNGASHAFYWYQGAMNDLGAIGTNSTPYGLNGADLIVGGSINGTVGAAVIWNKFVPSNLAMPGGNESICLGVNSLSQIVGSFTNGTVGHAFLSENGVTRDLGTWPYSFWETSANAINNLGQIAGDQHTYVPLLWENESWKNVNDFILAKPAVAATLLKCIDINDRGQIVCFGFSTISYNDRGFLLTPLMPATPRPFLQSPTNQQRVFTGQSIPMTITLLPDATSVQKVDFYRNGQLIGTSSNAPYNFTWTAALSAGSNSISAQVTSVNGGTAFSPAVTVVRLDSAGSPTYSGFSATVTGTNAATGSRTMQFTATVNPGSLDSLVKFQYGLSSSYAGTNGPVSVSGDVNASNVTVTVPGFSSGVTYHWNVAGTNVAGSSSGPDQTFTIGTPSGSGVAGDTNGDGLVSQAEFEAVYGNYVTNSPWLYMTNVAGLGQTNVTFALNNPVLSAYTVQSSTNLVDWMTLGSASPRYLFTHTNAPANVQYFYRLIYP